MLVNGAGKKFFPGAGFAFEQNGNVPQRNALRSFDQMRHDRTSVVYVCKICRFYGFLRADRAELLVGFKQQVGQKFCRNVKGNRHRLNAVVFLKTRSIQR